MKQVAYYTAIINILAEKTIREITNNTSGPGFDDDPRNLVYFMDNDGRIIGSSSRRFDGAYPSIQNPRLIWEIKEYYYNKSFGSRIADGVYETQLDGFELNAIYDSSAKWAFFPVQSFCPILHHNIWERCTTSPPDVVSQAGTKILAQRKMHFALKSFIKELGKKYTMYYLWILMLHGGVWESLIYAGW